MWVQDICGYKTFVGTLHYTLENGADLYVNEGQKIQHHRARSAEGRRRRMSNRYFLFFISRGVYINCAIIAMLYTHLIGNQQ